MIFFEKTMAILKNCQADPVVPIVVTTCLGTNLYFCVKGISFSLAATSTLQKITGVIQIFLNVYMLTGALIFVNKTLINLSEANRGRSQDEGWQRVCLIPLAIFMGPIWYYTGQRAL